MKRSLSIFALLVIFSASAALAEGPNKYLGSASCKACHNNDKMGGKQYPVWEQSAHAKALKTLQTPEADKIAVSKGFKTKAAETPECLACHLTGKDQKDAAFEASFKDEGVGCEACHGPASAYKSKHGKNKPAEEAKAAGLMMLSVADKSAEKQCKECHNDKSPTFKGFKFDEYWKKIAHPKPQS